MLKDLSYQALAFYSLILPWNIIKKKDDKQRENLFKLKNRRI
jgi:hypothetical protein